MNQPEEIKLLPCPCPMCGVVPEYDEKFLSYKIPHTSGCFLQFHISLLQPSQINKWNTRTPNEATKESMEDKARLLHLILKTNWRANEADASSLASVASEMNSGGCES